MKSRLTLEPPLRVGVDILPKELFENSRDWSELAITRLLSKPLFEELPDRGICSNLVSECHRTAEFSWKITLSEQARWNSGQRITSLEICQQIMRARQAKAASLLPSLMIKSMRAETLDTITIETRIPLAHLDRVLANPGLAPRIPMAEATTGPYVITFRTPSLLRLTPLLIGRTLDLVGPSDIFGLDQFTANGVDISGPISIRPENWITQSMSSGARTCPLDIVYILIVPSWMSVTQRYNLQMGLSRVAVCRCTNGLAVPCHKMTDIWSGKEVTKVHQPIPDLFLSQQREKRLKLFYTPFPGNLEMAHGAAQELFASSKIKVSLTECGYSEFISRPPHDYENDFRLALISSPWPHPVGMLAPFFFGSESSATFRDTFLKAADINDLESAAAYASEAETNLINEGSRFIALGRVNGCFRSRVGNLWCPPSGWVDYSLL